MMNILVPTDFSKNAETALYYAIELAKKEKAQIILLHVYDIPYTVAEVSYKILQQELSSLKKEAQNKLKALSLKIEKSGNIPYQIINVRDYVIDAILNTVPKQKIDIIVMGTHGATGLSKVIFGSVAAKVIEKAECPVIAVPDEAAFTEIHRITYATDYRKSDLGNLRKTIDLAKKYNAQVNVLHISDDSQSVADARKGMKIFMEKVNSRIPYNNMSFQVISGKNTKKILQEYLDAGSTNMLVMSAHRRNFFDKIFGSSLTKKIAFETKIPLLALHNKDTTPIKVF